MTKTTAPPSKICGRHLSPFEGLKVHEQQECVNSYAKQLRHLQPRLLRMWNIPQRPPCVLYGTADKSFGSLCLRWSWLFSPVLNHSGFIFSYVGCKSPSGDEDGVDAQRVVRERRAKLHMDVLTSRPTFVFRFVLHSTNEQKSWCFSHEKGPLHWR